MQHELTRLPGALAFAASERDEVKTRLEGHVRVAKIGSAAHSNRIRSPRPVKH